MFCLPHVGRLYLSLEPPQQEQLRGGLRNNAEGMASFAGTDLQPLFAQHRLTLFARISKIGDKKWPAGSQPPREKGFFYVRELVLD